MRISADGARDRARVLDHVGEQLAEDLLVELVDLVVLAADAPGQLGVLAHEGVEALRSMRCASSAMRGMSM